MSACGSIESLLGSYDVALRDADYIMLAQVATEALSRASRAEGKIEGMAETIAYLKYRVKVLEARERGEDVALVGGEP